MPGISEEMRIAWVESTNVDPLSLHSYYYHLELYSSFLEQEGLELEHTTPDDVWRFARGVYDEHRQSTAHGIMCTVRRFYSWAAGQGICRDAARDVRYDDGWSQYTRIPLRASEALRIIDSAENARDRAMLSLAIRCDLKSRDIVAATAEGLLLDGGAGEIRLANGTWAPLTRACALDLRTHLAKQGMYKGMYAAPKARLFTAERRHNVGICLKPRTLRGVFSDAFRHAGMPLPAGEYATGSAAVGLAILEREPLDVVVSLCDRSYHYRKKRRSE